MNFSGSGRGIRPTKLRSGHPSRVARWLRPSRANLVLQRRRAIQRRGSKAQFGNTLPRLRRGLGFPRHSRRHRTKPDEPRSRVYWQGSLKRWERLLSDDRFWDKVTGRVRQIDDARLTTGFVRRMRVSLPEALNKINLQLAACLLRSCKVRRGSPPR